MGTSVGISPRWGLQAFNGRSVEPERLLVEALLELRGRFLCDWVSMGTCLGRHESILNLGWCL